MELIINELANKDHLTNDRQYNAGLRLIRENGYASVSGEPDVRYYCIKKGTSMKEDKKQWILGYMSQHKDESVDVVSENFVNAYVNKFNPKIVEWYPYGAPKVPKLGRLLAELYKENKVGRCRHRCENWQDGYPKWFYIYYLNGSRKRN